MNDFNRGYPAQAPARADMAVDAGLRAFMLGVYNKLALGLAVAGVLAWVTGNVPAVTQLLFAQTADGGEECLFRFTHALHEVLVVLEFSHHLPLFSSERHRL